MYGNIEHALMWARGWGRRGVLNAQSSELRLSSEPGSLAWPSLGPLQLQRCSLAALPGLP